jgi:hypothetical protein
MPTYRIEINGNKVDVQANSPEEIPSIYEKLKDVVPQKQPTQVAESPFEQPPGELQPQPFMGRQAREEASLNRGVPPELIAELRQAQTGEAPTQAEVAAFKKSAKIDSTRDYFNKLVSQGAIDINSSFDPQQSPTLAGAWEKYKQEMKPNVFGAAVRGASEQILPTIGGALGGFVAGTTAGAATLNPVVTIPAGIAGGVAGAKIGAEVQQAILPPSPAELAQRRFDEAQFKTRAARTIGEFAPSIATGVPSASRIGAIAGIGSQAAVAAARKTALIEGAIGGAAPFLSAGLFDHRLPTVQEMAEGAIMGAITRPTDLGTAMMMPRKQRTELAARRSAEKTMQGFSTTPQSTPEQVAVQIEQGVPTSPGARLFMGDITGNEGLLGLQEALMTTDAGLRQIRQDTRAAIASDLGATLAPQGTADIKAAQSAIQAQHDRLLEAAKAARETAIERGNRKAVDDLNEAIAEATKNKDAAQKGIIAADAALEASVAKLTQAGQQFAQAQKGRSRSDLSVTVEETLQKNAKEDKALHDEAYAKAREETGELAVNYTNTIEALKKVQKEAGRGSIPEHLNRMIRDLIRRPKKNQVNRVENIDSDYRNVAGELSDTDNRTYQRWLGLVKDALKADLETAGNASPLFAEANRLYFDYARKYIDGPASGVIASPAYKKTATSKTINAYTRDVESLRQLKESIKGDAASQKAIDDWFVDKFSEEVGSAPTAKSMDNWAMKQENRDFASVFPSAMAAVENAQAGMRAAEAGVESAKTARGRALEAVQETRSELTAKETSARQREFVVEREKKQQAKEAYRTEKERIEGLAANKILGRDAQKAAQAVFDSSDPVNTVSEVMSALRGNAQATQGFRNALSKYLNSELRSISRVETTLNQAGPIKPEEFSALFGRMNEFLTEGSPQRSVLEKVYGKDSKEMKALDIIRKQYELLARSGRTTQGQSQTALRTAIKDKLTSINENNSLGALQRIATGVDAKLGTATKIMSNISQLIRFGYRGNPSDIALKILVEAQTDPKLAAELLRGQTPDSIAKLRPYLKFYAQKQSEEEK